LVARGHVVVTPGFFAPVRMVGARLRVLPTLGFALKDRIHVRLHTGTADPLGEVVLLDARELEPGAEGLVQIRLEDEVVCAPGDPFILRLASPSITRGGGVILEESRHRLKRFKEFVIQELERQESSLDSPLALLETTLARGGFELFTPAELSQRIKRSVSETAAALAQLGAQKKAVGLGAPPRWMHSERLSAALGVLREACAKWFGENPHRQVVESLELKRLTEFEGDVLAALLDEAHKRGELVLEPGGHVRAPNRRVELDPELAALRERVLATLERIAFQPPTPAELAAQLAAPEKKVARVLELLVDEGSARLVAKDFFLAASHYDRAKSAVIANCTKHGHLEIPELRDALQTTRKFLIPLLEHFDAKGVTTRLGANRVLKKR
jgi:selenocysteine-specific elongation factor